MIKMNVMNKRICILGLLIIYLIVFYVMASTIFWDYAYNVEMRPFYIVQLVFFCLFFSATIFIIVFWFPLVYGIGPQRAWYICIPFLLIFMIMLYSNLPFLETHFILGIGLGGSLYIICFVAVIIFEEEGKADKHIRITPLLLSLMIIFQRFIFSYFLRFSALPSEKTPSEDMVFRLRMLMLIFPAIVLLVGSLAIWIEKR